MRDVGGASGAYVFDIDASGDGTLYATTARRAPHPGLEPEAVHDRRLPRRARPRRHSRDARLRPTGELDRRRRLDPRRRPGDRRRRRPGVRHGALRPRQRPARHPGRRPRRATIARAGIKRITRPGARRRHDLRPQAPRRPLPEPALGPLVQQRLRRRRLRPRSRSWSRRRRSKEALRKRGVKVDGPRRPREPARRAMLDADPLADVASPRVAR